MIDALVLASWKAAQAAGVNSERERIVTLLEADAAEWANASEAFHAAGDFESEEAAAACVTILRGTVKKIKAPPARPPLVELKEARRVAWKAYITSTLVAAVARKTAWAAAVAADDTYWAANNGR